ncbi:imelysin family protein [Chelativorans alearense]|uniref:imelysin family protein n=1 Tax=Chelativorans alearense TaxID=2681495 RepID=UPI0013D3F302|nr:imelysin family protein [Chelativorans alearense]
MLRNALLCLALACCLPAHAQDAAQTVPPDIGQRVAERYVAPSLAAFSGVTGRLDGKMGELCAAPGDEALEEARATFADTVRAWGPVSMFRFGPLVEENRFEHLFFWPDMRGVTLRQVQGVLADKDESAAAAASLKEKSVALQGLPALEFVLFGSGAEELAGADGAFRCRYGTAIATNLTGRAAELTQAWAPDAPFHSDFTRPAAGNALYRSPGEVAGEVVKALTTGLQFARNAELLPALGANPDKANGKRTPLWRSNLTFDLVGTQIEGMMGLVNAADFKTHLDAAGGAIVDSVLFDLEHALGALEEVGTPAETAFTEAEDRGRISYAGVALEGADHTISEQLSAAIGLTMGFNALDGD